MSVAEQVARIRGEKSRLASKLSSMKLANQDDKLEILVDAVEDIDDHGHPDIKIEEGKSTTLLPGYYHGVSITGINNEALDAEEFALQANKEITPDKKGHQVVCDEGYYGLSSVTVKPIPKEFQIVTDVTATENDVLSPKIIVDKNGQVLVGKIPSVEGKIVTPIKSGENSLIVEAGTYVKGDIAVESIPAEYAQTADATATANDIELNKTAYVNGQKITGTLPVFDHKDVIGTTDDFDGIDISVVAEIDRCIIDGEVHAFVSAEEFGDAESPNVLEGKTFTSKSGLRVSGTMKQYDASRVYIDRDESKDTNTHFRFSAYPGYDNYRVSDKVYLEMLKLDLGTVHPRSVLEGNIFSSMSGISQYGTMPNNGAGSATVNLMTNESATLGEGYYSSVTFGITNDLEQELSSI